MFRKRRRTFSESLRVKTPFTSRIKEIEDPSGQREIAKTEWFDEFFDRVGAGWRMIAKRKARVRSNHVAGLCWRTPYAKSTTLAPYVRITGLRIFGSRRGEFRSAMCTPLPVPRAISTRSLLSNALVLGPGAFFFSMTLKFSSELHRRIFTQTFDFGTSSWNFRNQDFRFGDGLKDRI